MFLVLFFAFSLVACEIENYNGEVPSTVLAYVGAFGFLPGGTVQLKNISVVSKSDQSLWFLICSEKEQIDLFGGGLSATDPCADPVKLNTSCALLSRRFTYNDSLVFSTTVPNYGEKRKSRI